MVQSLWTKAQQFTVPQTMQPGSAEREMAEKLSIVVTSAIPILLVCLIIGDAFVFAKKLIPTILILANLIIVAVCCYLARRGQGRSSAWVLLAGSWMVVTITAWLAGGLASIIPIYYVVLSIAGGWLLGRPGQVFNTVTSCAAVAFMAAMETAGPGLHRYLPVPPLAALLVFGVAIALVTVPFLQLLQALERAQSAARRLETVEGSLRSAEARHRALFTFMREAIFVADAETGLIVDANPTAEELIGRPLDELRTLHQAELHPSDETEMAARGFAEQIRRPGIAEGRLLHRDGRQIPVEVATTVSTEPSGKTLAFGLFRDISERKRAEEALRRSEERFRQVAESASEFIWEVDALGRYTYCSPQMEKLWGMKPEEMIGKRPFDVMPVDDKNRVIESFLQAVQSPQPFRGSQSTAYDPQGRQVYVETNGVPFFDDHGHLLGFRGMSTDITERKQAEETLRNSELKYRRLHESMMDAVVTVDMEGNILEFNPPYAAMLGYTAGELRRMTYQEVTPERWHAFESQIVSEQVLAKGHSEVYEKEYRRRDGTVFPVELRAYLLRDETNQPSGIWAIVRDITERKRAADALQQSEEKFATLFRCSPASIAISDLEDDERTTDVNDAFERFSGYGREEVLGQRLDRLWLDPGEYALAVSQFERTGSLVDFEFRFRHKDGSEHTGLISGQAMELEGKICMITSAIDITGRKQAEKTLAASEEKYRALVEATGTGYLILDRECRIIDANQEYVRLTGHTELGEIVGRSILEWSAAHDQQRNEEAMARCLMDGFIRNYVADYVNGDNRITPIEMNAKVTGSGESTRIISLCRDITERKRAEEALRESEERFRNIADTCPAIIWHSDPDGQVTFVNKHAAAFSGRESQEFLGVGWVELMHPDDRAQVGDRIVRPMSNRSSFAAEFRLRRHDGEYRWMLDSGVPRFVGDVYVGHTGMALDITDLKRGQEQVLAAQKLESLSVLANGIAHDFNNMLGGILAHADLALSELSAGSAAADGIHSIRGIAVRAAEMVRQLFAYAGQEGTSFEPVDLSRLVGEMLDLLRVSISRRAALKTGLAENLPAVLANAPQVRRIVMNLVMNASEALGENEGVITVTTAQVCGAPGSVSEFGTACDRDYIRLEVSDSGCGMSEEIQARMFDPFFSTKFAGRGMGLAAVHGIVRSHGGAIDVISAPGQGTRIGVLLPCAAERAVDHRAARTQFRRRQETLQWEPSSS